MKTYKINNVEVSADQIKEIIKNNPELLDENKRGRYFLPNLCQWFWYICPDGSVDSMLNNTISDVANKFIAQGVYRTQEEAELARDKQKAIVACWKWAQENAPFEPDWGDDEQDKYYVYFFHDSHKVDWATDLLVQSQFTLPYFKSLQDCVTFIVANKEHLELLFKN